MDFLSKKMKKNEGEVPQYYVENSHPAIIPPLEWDMVQREFARRKAIGRKYSSGGFFASRLVCGDCGKFFGGKVWHSDRAFRKTIWRCNAKYAGDKRCTTPNLDEEEIKRRFIEAVNTLFSCKSKALEECRTIQTTLTDCTAIDAELGTLMQEMELLAEMTKKCIEENSRNAQDQDVFAAKYNRLVERYESTKARASELQDQRSVRQSKADEIGAFMFTLHEMETAAQEFDPKLWLTTVEKATVHSDGRIAFRFISGMEVTV